MRLIVFRFSALCMFALAVAGALGVAHMLKILRDELEITMALAGTPTLRDIAGSGAVRKRS